MNRATRRRSWAAALMLSTATAMTTTPVGFAAAPIQSPAQTPATSASTANPSDIPAGATGTLRIHRLYGGAGGDKTPVAGVVMKVSRVEGVDLRTSAGWGLVSSYGGDTGRVASSLGRSYTSAPTDSRGLTTFFDLPVGLYLVQEVSGGSGVSGYVPSDDILVTIPATDPTSNRWVYTRDVYPKTSGSSIVKSVADGNAGMPGQDAPLAGHVLTYTLDAGIPAHGLKSFGGRCTRGSSTDGGSGLDAAGFTSEGLCAPGATYVGTAAGAAYEIVDDLTESAVPGSQPPRRTSDYLEYRAADWAGGVGVSITGAAARDLVSCSTAPTGGCDYTLGHEAHRVRIAMTDRGLQALTRARSSDQDAKVRVTVKARVRPGTSDAPAPVEAATRQSTDALDGAVPATVLNLPNTAVVFPSGRAKSGGTPVSSNTVVTKYSTLKLHKVDAADDSSLAGAVFTLYRTRTDAEAGANPLAVSEPTDAAGMTQFAGVHVTDYQNDTFTDDSYWIVETRTPAGYRSGGHPIEVKVLMDGTTVGADHTLGKPIVNERGDTPGATPGDPSSPNPGGSGDSPSPGVAPGSGTDPSGSSGSSGSSSSGSSRPSWVPPLSALPYTGMEVAAAAALAAALVTAGVLLRRASRDKEQAEA